MPTQYDMEIDTDLYRGVLNYEHQRMEWQADPSNPRRSISVLTGPEITVELVVGPFVSPAPIKAYITRHRLHRKNLRIARVEKVSGWKEVENY